MERFDIFQAPLGDAPRPEVSQPTSPTKWIRINSELVFAAFRPGEPLVALEIKRNAAYIECLRKAEKQFMEQLAKHGHTARKSLIGRRVA